MRPVYQTTQGLETAGSVRVAPQHRSLPSFVTWLTLAARAVAPEAANTGVRLKAA